MQNTADITAIVLCGGLGTRLRSVVNDVPKPMVEVADKPFLEYIIDYLINQGVEKIVLAVSYRKEQIIEHFGKSFKGVAIHYSVETEPLGTGGAIKQALEENVNLADGETLVVNGDTFVEYQLDDMLNEINVRNSDIVFTLKHMSDTSRYGRITHDNCLITGFEEKKSGVGGYINAGVYLVKNNILSKLPEKSKFSFEQDFLEKSISCNCMSGVITSGYFIDIGIPNDYKKAQEDFKSGFN
ncbi:nucleotidyltransferase family protein [Photobacterium sp. BZF1]|uniref:nucleotidyltransferase family protein n=1 Tax=Photobacterium sp. BZF1 TaxID=1904457 RepID=UPI001653CB42|nr:nucleotidyltransferase family protein [Photobacterium sp. BZF1]MBC7003556.1 nucleotidyltransferase family protein [Photobacterium sp. BZF1]